MNLNLQRPLTFFDLETTHKKVSKARIVEISLIKLNPDATRETITRRVNPGIPIPAEATAIHGITDQDVALCPSFREIVLDLFPFLKGCDLAGFNILRYDLPLLVEEMLRAGVSGFPAHGTRFIDPMSIFHQYEPRDLTAALKFYCNHDHAAAHNAEADTLATIEVLQAQVEKYTLDTNADALHTLSTRGNDIIDFDGKFTRNQNGVIVFTFGKYEDEKVTDHPDFVRWMQDKNFTSDTRLKGLQIILGALK